MNARKGRPPISHSPSPILEASEETELLAELVSTPAFDVELLQPVSWLLVWKHRFIAFWSLLKSRAVSPDSFSNHPYTLPMLISIIGLWLFLPFRFYFSLVIVGVLGGYLWATPEATVRSKSEGESLFTEFLFSPSKFGEKVDKGSTSKLSISPAIDAELDVLLDDVLDEIINPWFVPLCKSGESEFQSCIRSTVNVAIMNLVKFGASRNKDMITLMLYGITNALIVHMEEYRSFECSKLPLDRFIALGRSRRNHHRNYSEELEHLRQISGLLLKKLLPKQESRSILLNSLLKEVISGNALAGLVDRLADPDFINEQIIKHMQDPSDSQPSVEPGWNMLVLKVLRGKNLLCEQGLGGLYLVIHISGRRIKTRRIKDPSQLWNEVFRFKISDAVKSNLKVYLQLCQFNYMGQDESLGYSKLVPEFESLSQAKTVWLKFGIRLGADQPVNRAAIPPEILLEVTTIVGETVVDSNVKSPTNLAENSTFAEQTPEEISSLATVRDNQTPSPHNGTETPSTSSCTQPGAESTPDHGMITLEAALQNNELFMEFLEYLNTVKAPPYLQFMMNVDALRQFAGMSLGIDSKPSNMIEDCFRKGRLSENQLEQLKMIKHDAADVFSTHFSENARYRIPLDPGMQQELQEWVTRSDRVDSAGRYIGGPIGPNIFLPAYKWVANILEEVYFPKFKSSESFGRFMDRARFSTLNFTVEDDRMSTFSHDSSALPPNWVYSDQTYVERQAMSVGGRSRISSFDNLGEAVEYETPDYSSEVKRIATEISISRQKVSFIDEQIEKLLQLGESPDSTTTLRSLGKEKNDLEKHVKNLISILEEKNSYSGDRAEDIWVDLRNAKVKVTPATHKTLANGDKDTVLSSLWSSTMGSVMAATPEPVFDIEIRPDDDINSHYYSSEHATSLVTRSYTEFYQLHRRLKKQFSKIGKITFPEQGTVPLAALAQNLETYLQMIISDEFVRQSSLLREFVTLDGDLDPEHSTAGQFMEAIVGKKVKDVLKSATQMLSGSPTLSEERRNRFYETRERHTSADVTLSAEARSSPGPVFHSVTELSTLGNHSISNSPVKEAKLKQRSDNATPTFGKLATITAAAEKSPAPKTKESLKKTPSVELPRLPQRQRPTKPPIDLKFSKITVIEELTESEIEMLVETFFAFIIETFDLREPNQWLRRKLLGVFKQLLKQAYGDTLNKVLTDAINSAFSESSILRYLHEIRQALYPDGVFISRRPPPPIRSEDQKFATMVEARTIFLKHTPDFVQNMAGRYNAVCGMTRIFHALQHKELNKTLIFACFDITLKLFFSERPNQ